MFLIDRLETHYFFSSLRAWLILFLSSVFPGNMADVVCVPLHLRSSSPPDHFPRAFRYLQGLRPFRCLFSEVGVPGKLPGPPALSALFLLTGEKLSVGNKETLLGEGFLFPSAYLETEESPTAGLLSPPVSLPVFSTTASPWLVGRFLSLGESRRAVTGSISPT